MEGNATLAPWLNSTSVPVDASLVDKPAPFIVIALLMLLLCCFFYHKYASFFSRPWYVALAVIGGWWLSSIIIFVIPLDVSSTLYRDCAEAASAGLCAGNSSGASFHSQQCCALLSQSDESYLGEQALSIIWRVVYWTAYVSIWSVYPVLASLVSSPEFKARKRWWLAVRENLIYYAVMGAFGIALAVYVGINRGSSSSSSSQSLSDDLSGLAITLANTFGLLLVIILLSIGLVRVPREVWRASNWRINYKHLKWQVADAHQEFEDAKRELLRVLKVIKKMDEEVPKHDPYRKYVNRVIIACPDEYSTVLIAEGAYDLTYAGIVKINGNLMDAKWNLVRSKNIYEGLLTRAFSLEDVLEHCASSNSRVRWSFVPKRRYRCAAAVELLESVWYRYLQRIALKGLALACVLLSLSVLWTECSFFTYSVAKVDLSLFSLLLYKAFTPLAVSALVWLPVGYMSVCVFSSLLSIRIFHFYRFLPNGATNSRTLIYSASYVGRIVPALCFNYLLMIHCGPENTDGVRSSVYSNLMGTMQVIPFAGGAFNLFFPMVLLLLVLAVLTNVTSKLLGLCRVRQFQFADDFDDEKIVRGQGVLLAERERLSRSWVDDSSDTENDLEAPVAEGASERPRSPTKDGEFPDVWGIFQQNDSRVRANSGTSSPGPRRLFRRQDEMEVSQEALIPKPSIRTRLGSELLDD